VRTTCSRPGGVRLGQVAGEPARLLGQGGTIPCSPVTISLNVVDTVPVAKNLLPKRKALSVVRASARFRARERTEARTTNNQRHPLQTDSNNASFQVSQGGALSGTAAALASDADGDMLNVNTINGQAVTYGAPILLPSGASVTVNSNGTWSYVPASGQVGSDSFTYTVSDGTNTSNSATVSLTVTNGTPSIQNGITWYVSANSTFTLSAPGLLGYASDSDGDPLTVATINGSSFTYGQPLTTHAGGTLIVNSDGSLTYTPPTGFQGQDDFTYTVTDGGFTSKSADVTIRVTTGAPVAQSVTYSVVHDSSLPLPAPGLLGNASDSDGDTALSVTTINGQAVTPDQPITLPSGATVIVGSDNSFTYTPPANWIGTDSFTYTVSDGSLTSSPATITINITDQQPVANAEGPFTVLPGATLPIDVLANAYSADSASLTPVIVQGPTRGTATIVDGIIDYTPNPGVSSGTDQITYEVSDGILNSSPQTVSITVSSAESSLANPVYIQGTENMPVLFTDQDVLASLESVLGGTPLTITGYSDPSEGNLTRNNKGYLIYTPPANWTGTTTSLVTATDGQGHNFILPLFTDEEISRLLAQNYVYNNVYISSGPTEVTPNRLASIADPNTITVWNPQTGNIQFPTIRYNTFWPIQTAAFRPGNDNQLAIAGWTRRGPAVAILDYSVNPGPGTPGFLLLPGIANNAVVKSLSFSPDGNQLAVVAGNTLFVYQVNANGSFQQRPVMRPRNIAGGVVSAAFLPNTVWNQQTRSTQTIPNTLAVVKPTEVQFWVPSMGGYTHPIGIQYTFGVPSMPRYALQAVPPGSRITAFAAPTLPREGGSGGGLGVAYAVALSSRQGSQVLTFNFTVIGGRPVWISALFPQFATNPPRDRFYPATVTSIALGANTLAVGLANGELRFYNLKETLPPWPWVPIVPQGIGLQRQSLPLTEYSNGRPVSGVAVSADGTQAFSASDNTTHNLIAWTVQGANVRFPNGMPTFVPQRVMKARDLRRP
jgi:hypothetical protein